MNGPLSGPPGGRDSVLVELPVRRGGRSVRVRHVDVRLTSRQADALSCVFDGCDEERIGGGRRVANAADALRLILDRLADAMTGS